MDKLADGQISDAVANAMEASVPAVAAAAKQGALTGLPKRGGLARRVHDNLSLGKHLRRGKTSTLTIRVNPSGKSLVDPEAADRGRLKHPTFGHEPSVIQLITPGWFSNATTRVTPTIKANIAKALDKTIRKA